MSLTPATQFATMSRAAQELYFRAHAVFRTQSSLTIKKSMGQCIAQAFDPATDTTEDLKQAHAMERIMSEAVRKILAEIHFV